MRLASWPVWQVCVLANIYRWKVSELAKVQRGRGGRPQTCGDAIRRHQNSRRGSGVATKPRKAAQCEACYSWQGQKPGNAGSQRHACSYICKVEVFVLNPQHLSDTMNVFPWAIAQQMCWLQVHNWGHMQNSLLCLDVITVERFNLKFTYEEFWITGFAPTTLLL